MHLFSKSFLPDKLHDAQVDEAKLLIGRVRATMGFVVDVGGKIQHQWSLTCGMKPGSPLGEWVVQALKEGKIKPVVPLFPENHRKKLRIDCGFPEGQFEGAYIAVANVTQTRYIVTVDMHFFEPKHKDADENAKRRSRDERKGSVCRYLMEQMHIRVGTPVHAAAELWANSP
jgi:hypothetical protein